MSDLVCTPFRPPNWLPTQARAGNSIAWSVQTQLAAGMLVFFVLTGIVNGAPTRITVGGSGVAVDATGLVTFAIPSSTTSAWAAARYNWVGFTVDGDGNRSELASGAIDIAPDPAGTNPVDIRSYDEKLLAQIKALMAGKALDDVQMYKIGTRELTKMLLPDLLKWEANLEARVRNARRRKRGKNQIGRTAQVTFGGHR